MQTLTKTHQLSGHYTGFQESIDLNMLFLTGPAYLSELLAHYIPACALRSGNNLVSKNLIKNIWTF